MTNVVVITDASTRADIIEALGYLNTTAKMLRRQGYSGIHGQSYARIHGHIDDPITQLTAGTCRHCGRTQDHCVQFATFCCPLCQGSH